MEHYVYLVRLEAQKCIGLANGHLFNFWHFKAGKNVHVFTSHFMTKFLEYGYTAGVALWYNEVSGNCYS